MQKYFCDICGAELTSDYKRSDRTVCRAAAICEALDLCPSCAFIGSDLVPAEILGQEWRRRAAGKAADRETPEFRGRGGEEKREIFQRLRRYREQHGLGKLSAESQKVGISETTLRQMLMGDKLPIETWRTVGNLMTEDAARNE